MSLGRPAALQARGGLRYSTEISSLQQNALRRLCSKLGQSLWFVMIAALAVLLHKMSGDSDLVLSIPLEGRTKSTRRALAMMSNVLPLRLAVGPNSTLEDMTKQVSSKLRLVLRHSRVRGEQIARELLGAGVRSFGPTVNILDHDYEVPFARHAGIPHNLSLGPVSDLSFIFVYKRAND